MLTVGDARDVCCFCQLLLSVVPAAFVVVIGRVKLAMMKDALEAEPLTHSVTVCIADVVT